MKRNEFLSQNDIQSIKIDSPENTSINMRNNGTLRLGGRNQPKATDSIKGNQGSKLMPIFMDKEIVSTLQENLLKDLFPKALANNEKYSAFKIFENQPIRKEEIVDISYSTILSKLEKEVVEDIKAMENRIENGEIKNETDDRPVKVLDPRYFHIDSKLPTSVRELLLYMHWKLRIPADCHSNIRIFIAKRQGRTNCRPPKTKDTACRIITHFGPDDVYKLSEILTNGQNGDSTDHTMVNGSSLLLDKHQLKEYGLYISPNPKILFPSSIPTDVDIEAIAKAQMSKMKVPGKGRVSVDTNKIKSMTQRRGIRARKYVRLTVIIDFGKSVYIEESKILDVARTVNRINAPNNISGGIPTELPEHIRAQLPQEIRGVVENAGGKLNRKVSEIGRNIVSDLGNRPELYSDQPNITNEFVSDVATSAIRNIKLEDVKELAPDIDKLAETIGTDNLPIDPKLKRRMKREERKNKAPRRNFTSNSNHLNDDLDTSIDSDSKLYKNNNIKLDPVSDINLDLDLNSIPSGERSFNYNRKRNVKENNSSQDSHISKESGPQGTINRHVKH